MTALKSAILPAFVALMAALLFLSIYASADQSARFNGWLSACQDHGGHAALTHHGEWADRYECFKADRIIVIPGFGDEE